MAYPTPNSSTGGYLTPTAAAPPYDDALEDIIQPAIVGITGLTDPSLVRPRWQPEPPDEPEGDTNWVAFGITDSEHDWDSYQRFNPAAFSGQGAIETQQTETFELFVSFYGPNARGYQTLFEDGLKLSQNREALEAQGIVWIETRKAFRLPALLNNRWVNRIDQKYVFRRRVVRQYAVLTIASAQVRYLDNEQYLTQIDINPPPSP